MTLVQLALERLSERRARGQDNVNQLRFDGVVGVSFFEQHVKALCQASPCVFVFTLCRMLSGRDASFGEHGFVEVAGIAKLARHELDLKVGVTQRVKVLGYFRIDGFGQLRRAGVG